jgi:hypothetical protein
MIQGIPSPQNAASTATAMDGGKYAYRKEAGRRITPGASERRLHGCRR